MKFEFDIIGSITKDIDADIKKFEVSQQNAVRIGSEGLKKEWRAQVVGAGLGEKLSRSVRSKYYANKDTGNPAALVYTKSPQIIRAFDLGVTIRAKKKKYLAIPTQFAPQKGVGSGNGNFRARVTPQNFPTHKFGKLEFVPALNGRPAMLVVKDQRESRSRKTGQLRGYRKASDKFGGLRLSIPMFILVPAVKLPDRLDIAPIIQKWGNKMIEIFEDELVKNGFVS